MSTHPRQPEPVEADQVHPVLVTRRSHSRLDCHADLPVPHHVQHGRVIEREVTNDAAQALGRLDGQLHLHCRLHPVAALEDAVGNMGIGHTALLVEGPLAHPVGALASAFDAQPDHGHGVVVGEHGHG